MRRASAGRVSLVSRTSGESGGMGVRRTPILDCVSRLVSTGRNIHGERRCRRQLGRCLFSALFPTVLEQPRDCRHGCEAGGMRSMCPQGDMLRSAPNICASQRRASYVRRGHAGGVTWRHVPAGRHAALAGAIAGVLCQQLVALLFSLKKCRTMWSHRPAQYRTQPAVEGLYE